MTRPASWRTIGEVMLVAEMVVIAATPFDDLFEPGVLAWRILVAAFVALAPGVLLRPGGRRPAAFASLLFSLAAFLLVAAVGCFHDRAVAGVLPGPEFLSGIRDGLVDGPRLVLTSAVPAPATGEMLLVPIALVYWAVAVGTELTWRTRSRLAAPSIAVALFGLALTFQPAGSSQHTVPAAVVAGLSMLYVMARARSSVDAGAADDRSGTRSEGVAGASGSAATPGAPAPTGSLERGRAVALATLGVAAVVGIAVLATAIVPVSSDRYALRDSVQAPVDPVEQLNPLQLVNLQDRDPETDLTPVLTATTPTERIDSIRLPIARLTRYGCDRDGFRSIGRALVSADQLPALRHGQQAAATSVDVKLDGAWSRVLPTPGTVASVSVADGRSVSVDPSDRLLILDSTPVEGVEYRVQSVLMSDLGASQGDQSAVIGAADQTTAAAFDRCRADELALARGEARTIVAVAGDDLGRLRALVSWCAALRRDPQAPQGDDLSLHRLFVAAEPVGTAVPTGSVVAAGGTAAQVVTACAVVGQLSGLPVRVAAGYIAKGTSGSTVATRASLSVWLEVRDASGLWRSVPVLGDPKALPPPDQGSSGSGTGDDPGSPPTTSPTIVTPTCDPDCPDIDGSDVKWLLVVGVAAIAVATLAWRASAGVRRRRRRRSGTPSQRLAGAWMEAVDTLGSVGVIADAFGPEDIARTADSFPGAAASLRDLGSILDTTFAPDPPGAEQADAAWRAVGELRRGIRSKRTGSHGNGRVAPSTSTSSPTTTSSPESEAQPAESTL